MKPENKMGTNHNSKWRKFRKAAFRRWPRKRKHPNDAPSRELRRSW